MRDADEGMGAAFWWLTIGVTLICPFLLALWPLSGVAHIFLIDAHLFFILPLALCTRYLLRARAAARASWMLACAMLALGVSAYVLQYENLYMHAHFEPRTFDEKLQRYACFGAFGYACLWIAYSAVALWGRIRDRV